MTQVSRMTGRKKEQIFEETQLYFYIRHVIAYPSMLPFKTPYLRIAPLNCGKRSVLSPQSLIYFSHHDAIALEMHPRRPSIFPIPRTGSVVSLALARIHAASGVVYWRQKKGAVSTLTKQVDNAK